MKASQRFIWIASVTWIPSVLCGQGVAPPTTAATYVGSAACKTCHPAMYARWSKTRMAGVVRDVKEHPEAIIPDLTKADPLLTFTKDDIAANVALVKAAKIPTQ